MQRYDFFLNYCMFMLSAKVDGSRVADGRAIGGGQKGVVWPIESQSRCVFG